MCAKTFKYFSKTQVNINTNFLEFMRPLCIVVDYALELKQKSPF